MLTRQLRFLSAFFLLSLLPELSGAEWRTEKKELCRTRDEILTVSAGTRVYSGCLYPVDLKRKYKFSGKYRLDSGAAGTVQFSLLCLNKNKQAQHILRVPDNHPEFRLLYAMGQGDQWLYTDREIPFMQGRIITFDPACADRSKEYKLLTAPGNGKVWRLLLERRLAEDYPAKTPFRIIWRSDALVPCSVNLDAGAKWQEFAITLCGIHEFEDRNFRPETAFVRLVLHASPDDARPAKIQFRDVRFESLP